MIDVQQLSYSIQDTPILTNLSFQVPTSCVFHIQADNGAGKTTLLQLLCGLKQPESGLVNFNNQSIQDQLRAYQQQLIYIGHQIPMQNHLSIAENWLLSGVSVELYHQALTFFQLDQYEHLPAGQLSAGQKKKAALMMLVLYSRLIWILDEPFVGLDQQSVTNLLGLIEKHVHNGRLVLLTSHQPLPHMTCDTVSYQI